MMYSLQIGESEDITNIILNTDHGKQPNQLLDDETSNNEKD